MVKEFSVKITMHKGQGHSVGAHAPNFKVTKQNLIDLNPSLKYTFQSSAVLWKWKILDWEEGLDPWRTPSPFHLWINQWLDKLILDELFIVRIELHYIVGIDMLLNLIK